ncbi:PH domain-containing protein [Streptoalloteichus hindustanus]|uniref:PH domain-containing protein n=1 Tax=Streptoalloteichus hindustanus TaxID=2017 RepID=UPI000936472F|nr:PH domain-containing protein [Streptoalloteichus hindustanus]
MSEAATPQQDPTGPEVDEAPAGARAQGRAGRNGAADPAPPSAAGAGAGAEADATADAGTPPTLPPAEARAEARTEAQGTSETPASEPSPTPAPHAVFRISPIGVFAILFLAVCVTPVAWGAPGLQVVYLVPLALLVWWWRVRTVVRVDEIVVREVFRTRRLPWDDIVSLRLSERSVVTAVLRDETEVPLPSVRARHVPVLAAISGRLPEPGAASATVGEDPSATPEAADTPAADAGPGADGHPRSREDA